MKTEIISYTIGEQFACYVEYGDASGLDEREIRLFDALHADVKNDAPEGYIFGHWSINTENRDEFTRCDVMNLHGSCYQFDAVYLQK